MEEYLDIASNEFELLFTDIKRRYLSNPNFPKLIVGTGLSITMNIPGMSALAAKLDEKFESTDDTILKETWEKYRSKIKTDGLEAALLDVSIHEELFIEKIREITSEFILDEIEAALDDVNVHRFAEYIKEYSKKNQFIVITHRKGTMEVASSVYGITMQEYGISKVVSMKLK